MLACRVFASVRDRDRPGRLPAGLEQVDHRILS